jgi:hypothetical protein
MPAHAGQTIPEKGIFGKRKKPLFKAALFNLHYFLFTSARNSP